MFEATTTPTTLRIYTKGLVHPNPGHAAWGWLYAAGNRRITDSGYLGDKKTNNEAAYVAIGMALRAVVDKKLRGEITVCSDSQIAVKQIHGEYECNTEALKRYLNRCRELLRELPLVKVEWIPADKNESADLLSRMAYFEALGHFPPRYKKK